MLLIGDTCAENINAENDWSPGNLAPQSRVGKLKDRLRW